MYLYKALASKWTEAASTVATSVSNKTPSMRSISNAGFALSLSSVISDKLVRIVRALCAALMFALISFNCIAEMAPISQDVTFQNNFFQNNLFQSNAPQGHVSRSNASQANVPQSNILQHKAAQDKNSEAVEQVDKMLSRLGGRKVWQSVRSLYTMEKARHPKYGDGIIASHWRDLEEPAEKGELKHANLSTKYAWNAKGGWVKKDGRLREYIDDEVRGKMFVWQRDFFTLVHQLALGNEEYVLMALKPFGFRVLDLGGEKIADFKLTVDGELYYWHQYDDTHPMSLVFGPTQSFGAIQLPQWVSSVKGDWSYIYIQVMPSDKPLEEWVSFASPGGQWHGGAVNKDCPADG
jgi:hypothetical protein|tara:strand:+ start:71 stop:1123 length:1053 start_codon:yes stop_codon:yes gene_type:complete